uniref:Arabinogalactan peptide 22 n=1 Tax=Oryza punctata TaxID=4537 RepID=A0A0E0JKM5_ORYPU
MATLKVYLLLFTAFFLSGLMQLSMAQGAAVAAAPAARVIDAKAIDQAIAYLLMFAALFVTYFSH